MNFEHIILPKLNERRATLSSWVVLVAPVQPEARALGEFVPSQWGPPVKQANNVALTHIRDR